ncbi:DEAD/DEAH box helicase [Rhodococcus qingshengii]|uniref:DEAD/DEAH box helicase n=1 Tax=Rhodococcus qingshengii TaxID=334542 RepID=UPI0002B7BFA5|nr:DEAD/DEAH box helicase [Rhodococcus qingshengii]EME23885.1 hypothetical protein G418_07787 [Rhodococcus qingshengii BKS 20-40]
MTDIDLGASHKARSIRDSFQRALEATYPIRDELIAAQRRELLEQPGVMAQNPYLEITPTYRVGTPFADLKIPPVAREILGRVQGLSGGVGVYPPYLHQSDALERFFAPGGGDDLIVATGTGSGKTETFLYTILSSLAIEAAERPQSIAQNAVRAVLLYPLNALVSDQTARLRKLFGDPRVAQMFTELGGRNPLFGMYTSRAPYPGPRTAKRDANQIQLLVSYYEQLQRSGSTLMDELRERGRFPAKDIAGFAAPGPGQYTTQPGDRELLTRHEMQTIAPDLLVTNYSMLEYMLLRPIESSIFDSTSQWLASDERNELLLVLDEAHMYRGAAGAEVGLLLRRLAARLGIGRDRVRCVLTSASLGSGNGDEETVAFAQALTGTATRRRFTVVRGAREEISGTRPATRDEAETLANVDTAALAAAHDTPTALKALDRATHIVCPNAHADMTAAELRCLMGAGLANFGPAMLLVDTCSGNATELAALAAELFPQTDVTTAERALDGLLALGAFARRPEPGRSQQPMLPARVHAMFRGLPPVYACIDPQCTNRVFPDPSQSSGRSDSEPILGTLYDSPRTQCDCGARVFELITHRECGAAYLRAYSIDRNEPRFLWHEPGGLIGLTAPLAEIVVFIDKPHPKRMHHMQPLHLDIATGRVLPGELADSQTTRVVWRPKPGKSQDRDDARFTKCPACLGAAERKNYSLISGLATTGEKPFAELVRHQFVSQHATLTPSDENPNGGRKVLVFSDGRQKAARLARDLPREVADATMRDALVLATHLASSINSGKPSSLRRLYKAFVAVCAQHHLTFFDGKDQENLIDQCKKYLDRYEGDFEYACDEDWSPVPLISYRAALHRQLCDPASSLTAAAAVVLAPTPAARKQLVKKLSQANIGIPDEELDGIASAWLTLMLADGAIDPQLSNEVRRKTLPYFAAVNHTEAHPTFFTELATRLQIPQSETLELRAALFDALAGPVTADGTPGQVLDLAHLSIRLAMEDYWWHCQDCGRLTLLKLAGGCPNLACGGKQLELRAPDHPTFRSMKDHLRAPLREVLSGHRKPMHINAEEHTAQLSQRDNRDVHATTEKFELRFQNVRIDDAPVVDVLSCTTTMEVGIDIGSLTAVALRTMPPMRENYQQRAGRAGRRGSAVSTVLTYSDGGPHDSYYFHNPHPMISGPTSKLRVKDDNPKLARRHIHAFLLQTYFHTYIGSLMPGAVSGGIMSSLGAADDFFSDQSQAPTFRSFTSWVSTQYGSSTAPGVVSVAAWLPSRLFGDCTSTEQLEGYVAEVAANFCDRLEDLSKPDRRRGDQTALGELQLLDLLFDEGLLPSYAFPTNVCSFFIQDNTGGKVVSVERPQLSKQQALSEFAPGRTLVVNKKTYRSGGIFFPSDKPGSNRTPAAEHFTKPLSVYTGCTRCPYVRMDDSLPPEGTSQDCPVCTAPLVAQEFIDPPGFYPQGATDLSEDDVEQVYTQAGTAQMPEFADRGALEWFDGPGVSMRHAFHQDCRLVVVNRGKNAAGFGVCEQCGAAWPDDDIPGRHDRPFRLDNFQRRGSTGCSGHVRGSLFLAHEFLTDVLLLQLHVVPPMGLDPRMPWTNDALTTLAEAIALGASIHLDIDHNEISAGYRLTTPDTPGAAATVEIFLYDTASGGAGFSADTGRDLRAVLQRVRDLLAHCPSNCSRSCTRCLRHYRNRFLHTLLDRHLALVLLDHALEGAVPAMPDQAPLLRPLARYLELEGWQLRHDSFPDQALMVQKENVRRTVVVYPALLDESHVRTISHIDTRSDERITFIPDYAAARDLPAVYRNVAHGTPWGVLH